MPGKGKIDHALLSAGCEMPRRIYLRVCLAKAVDVKTDTTKERP